MKYLKKFEHFTGHDLGRFTDEEEIKDVISEPEENEQIFDEGESIEDDEKSDDEITWEEEREEEKGKVWGDEVVEKKKINAGFQAYLDKQKSKKDSKDSKSKKDKPDFLDLDKDGDKKESMKKASKDAKESKGESKLTAAQKKLPEGLRKAIEAKKK
jgi:hypothetical protein